MVRPLTVALALLFVAYAGVELTQKWESARVVPNFWWALLASAPLFVAVVVQAYAWIALIDHLTGAHVARGRALVLFFDSQIARYTPGKVGLPVVRMAGAQEIGAPARLVGASVLIEVLSWAALGGGVGLLAVVALSEQYDAAHKLLGALAWPVFAALLVGVLVLLVVDRQRLPARLNEALKLRGAGALAPFSMLALQLVFWVCWGVHGYLVAHAYGVRSADAVGQAGFFLLAPVAGFLALAAPAGIGVREAVLAVGLSPLLGGSGALSAAALSRGLSLFADVSTWLIVRYLGRRRARNGGQRRSLP